MMPEMVAAGVSPGMAIMSRPTGSAGHSFELFKGQRAGTDGRPTAGILGSRTVNIQPFSPAFPLAESPAKAFFLVIPLKF